MKNYRSVTLLNGQGNLIAYFHQELSSEKIVELLNLFPDSTWQGTLVTYPTREPESDRPACERNQYAGRQG